MHLSRALLVAAVVITCPGRAAGANVWLELHVSGDSQSLPRSALERALRLFAPPDERWSVGAAPSDCRPPCYVVRVDATFASTDRRIQLALNHGDAQGRLLELRPESDLSPFDLAQAVVVGAQALLEPLVVQPRPPGSLPPEPATEEREPWFAAGASFTTAAGADYVAVGPVAWGRLRLAGPIWLALEGGAHLREAETAATEYRIRAFPISLLAGGAWWSGSWSWGISGGVIYMPMLILVEGGENDDEELWGGAVRAGVGYELFDSWRVVAQVGLWLHSDEVDIEAADRGNLFRLPKPLVTLSIGLEWLAK